MMKTWRPLKTIKFGTHWFSNLQSLPAIIHNIPISTSNSLEIVVLTAILVIGNYYYGLIGVFVIQPEWQRFKECMCHLQNILCDYQEK